MLKNSNNKLRHQRKRFYSLKYKIAYDAKGTTYYDITVSIDRTFESRMICVFYFLNTRARSGKKEVQVWSKDRGAEGAARGGVSVSYTHLTLPTNREV